MVQAIIFDLYNTLIYHPHDPVRALLSDANIDLATALRVATTNNYNTLEEMMAVLKPNHSIDLAPYEERLQHTIKNTKCYDDAMPMLLSIPHTINVGVITNLTSHFKQPFYDLDLDLLVDEVIFSTDAGYRKPDPQIYKLMSEKLNIPLCEMIMFGDTLNADVVGPKNVGMNAVLLDRTGTSSHEHITSLNDVVRYL